MSDESLTRDSVEDAPDLADGAAPAPRGGLVRAEFARRLRESGLVVHEAFGGAGHPVDLAVEDPERPGHVLVAIETDGPEYAAMHSTRDRDRLRGEQLARLGWEHVRVWTTDLFRDPARDISRVHAAVQKAASRRAAQERAARAATPVATFVPEAPLPVKPAEAATESAESTPEPVVESAVVPEPSVEGAVVPDPSVEEPTPSAEPTSDPQLTLEGLEASDAFAPTPDEGARKRRVRGRRATSKPTNTQPGQQLPGPLVADQADQADEADQTVDPAAVPDQTKDDTDAGWGEQPNLSAHDRWLLEQRPPHWGRD